MKTKQNQKLKNIIAFHGLAMFGLGIGMGIIRANSSPTSTTTGWLYVILGVLVGIFTTYSIIKLINQEPKFLKITNERRLL